MSTTTAPTVKTYMHTNVTHSSGTCKKQEMEAVCLESKWGEHLGQLDWPTLCIDVYKNFLADSTRKQYNRLINRFKVFCIDYCGEFPPEQNKFSAVLAEHLRLESSKTQRPESVLNSIIAAISNYFSLTGDIHPISIEIKNLVKALVKKETERPAGRTKIMPLQPFKELFEQWGDNELLTISQLRQKAVTLLTIACMARPSDLAPKVGLNRSQIEFHNEDLTIKFFGVKNDQDRAGFEVRIEPAEQAVIDPVSCLKLYMEKTQHLVKLGQDGPVFLTLRPPYKALTAQSISNILKNSISLTNLPSDSFSAKNFRPSAATAAIRSGCDYNTVRIRGRWKTESVFLNHYVYPVSEVNISQRILESNINLS